MNLHGLKFYDKDSVFLADNAPYWLHHIKDEVLTLKIREIYLKTGFLMTKEHTNIVIAENLIIYLIGGRELTAELLKEK